MKIGVVTFPGSLDDVDARRAVALGGHEAVALWHGDHDLDGVDAVVLPGGFSYGDYLYRAIEEQGRLRRGYFVAGRGAMQFALPGAVDRLRTFAAPGWRYARDTSPCSHPVVTSGRPSPFTSSRRTPSAPLDESSITCRGHAAAGAGPARV